MHVKKTITRTYSFYVFLLVIAVISVFFISYARHADSGDELQHRYQINNHLWLYITENREGDATVPFINRYYLTAEIIGTAKEVMSQLRQEVPFLVGGGSLSKIEAVDSHKIKVFYSGKIYSLSNAITYSLNDQYVNAQLSYQINE
ncbi:hypothetical protein [Rosenbergiella australiborealis]|uniref:hypothetical protein n=1 Tax=Rosenbergiella australiborealis TaxID=1544696 RepID=UPI001F4D6DFD|nr:hypothetical protein [Rosenbergiella australiborealis]